VRIPPEPFVISMAPVNQVFAPLGPNGPIGMVIKAAEGAIDAAISEVGKLRRPFLAIRDGVVGVLAPLRAVMAPIVSAIIVVLIGLAAQVLLYIVSVLALIRSRPAEFTSVLIARGPLALLGCSRRALLQGAFARAFGREPALPQGRLIEDLRARSARLQMEIAMLRTDFVRPSASTAAR
jgi:hypothetical protein